MVSTRRHARTCSPSQVASYNDQALLGTASTTAQANFDALHPIYRQIAALATWRKQYPALRRGQQVVRAQSKAPGLFAVSRIGSDGREILLAFNTSNVADHRPGGDRTASTRSFTSLHGECPTPNAPGRLKIQPPAFGFPRVRGSRRLEARTGGLRRVLLLCLQAAAQQPNASVRWPGALTRHVAARGAASRRRRAAGIQHPAQGRMIVDWSRLGFILADRPRWSAISNWSTWRNAVSTTPGSSPGVSDATCAITATRCARRCAKRAGASSSWCSACSTMAWASATSSRSRPRWARWASSRS